MPEDAPPFLARSARHPIGSPCIGSPLGETYTREESHAEEVFGRRRRRRARRHGGRLCGDVLGPAERERAGPERGDGWPQRGRRGRAPRRRGPERRRRVQRDLRREPALLRHPGEEHRGSRRGPHPPRPLEPERPRRDSARGPERRRSGHVQRLHRGRGQPGPRHPAQPGPVLRERAQRRFPGWRRARSAPAGERSAQARESSDSGGGAKAPPLHVVAVSDGNVASR